MSRHRSFRSPYDLTPREAEFLEAQWLGFSYEEISQLFDVTSHAVRAVLYVAHQKERSRGQFQVTLDKTGKPGTTLKTAHGRKMERFVR